MPERAERLNLDHVARLEESFAPLFDQNSLDEFEKRADVFRKRFSTVKELTTLKGLQLEESDAVFTQAKDCVTMAQRRLDLARKQISQNPNFKITWGSIQVKLYEKQNHLPLLLRPLKRFARKEHPFLTVMLNQSKSANTALEQARLQNEREKDKIRRESDKTMDEPRKALAAVSDRIFNLCEKKAGSDLETLKKYLKIMPERTDHACHEFALQHSQDLQYRERFAEFLRRTGRSTHIAIEGIDPQTNQAWINYLAGIIKDVTLQAETKELSAI